MTRILGRFASIIRWAVLLVPNFIWFCLVLVVGRPAVERISSQENATQTQTLEGTTGDEDVLNNVPHEPATVASFVPADLPTDSPAGSGPVRGGLDTTTTTILYAETAPYPKLPCVHRYDGQTHPPGVSVPVPEEVENEGDPSNASLSPLEDQQDPNTSQIEPSEQPTFSGDDQLGDGLHSAVPCWGLDHIVGEESLCPRRSNPPLNLEMTVALGVVERAHELVRMFLTDKDQHSLQRAIHLLDHVIPLISHTALSAAALYIQARSRYLLFSQTRDPSLLDQSIETLRAVLDLKAWGVAERHETLVLCGDAFGARYQHRGDVDDLNRGIVSYREALDELADLGKNRSPSLLSHLAVLLLKRHSIRRDDSSDLDDAIDLYSEALVLSAANDPSRPLLLSHLATALLNRYHKLKNVSDVEEAIMHHRKALLFFTSNHPNRTFSLNNLASALLARYNRLRQICDVEEVIACSREALSVSIDNPLSRASSLHNLASALLSRYCTLASVSDVEEAIVCSRDALLLRPDHHPDRPYTTNNLTNALLARYGRLGRIADLEETITHSREALLLYTGGHHPNRPTTLNILGNALYFRYTKLRHIPNLDEAIVLLREALSLLPDNHSSRPMHLNNLANALITRYRTLENTSDLGEAIVYSREALSLRSDGHADRPLSLDNLATALLGRYDQLKHVSDLEGAILHYQEALSLRPGDHPHRPSSLNNLAAALLARYNQLGHTPDLEETVIHLREALSLPNGNHADRPSTLNNFINALLIRYAKLGNISDVEEAISCSREALSLSTGDHPSRVTSLNHLAKALLNRYRTLGQIHDVEEAIGHSREALSLSADGQLSRAPTLNGLANALFTRYRKLGNLVDLEEALVHHREAVLLWPNHHPDRPSSLTNLANTLLARYNRLGHVPDLEEAIVRHREALSLRTDDHPSRPTHLNNLASALISRYQRLGKTADIEEAIVHNREALSLRPSNHPARPLSLNSMADALLARYEKSGYIPDVEEAVVHLREALSLRPGFHPERPSSLNNLASALLTCYRKLGDVADVEEAVTHHREALVLMAGNHPLRPSTLSNLGNTLVTRYKRLGRFSDLEEAIIHYREALSLRPGDTPDRPSSLNNLANALCTRCDRSGSISNLEEGIMLAKEALFMCHTDDPARSEYIFNLANLVYTRYEGMGDVGSQDEAICLYGEALSLRPGNHHGRAATLQSLGIALLARDRDESDRVVGMGYIEESLSLLPSHSPIRQTAIINLLLLSHRMKHSTIDWTTLRDRCIEVAKLTPPEHPSYSRMALLIAPIIHTWGEGVSELLTAIGLDPDLNAEDATLALLQSGSQSVASPSIYQLQATCAWIGLSQEFGRPCSLEMYHLMLQHLDLSVAYGSSLDIRRQQLTTHAVLLQARNMVSGAVAFAIEQGAVETAIEFLERGRSILLAQLSLYRAASGLETVAPELARRFYDLSWQAESATLTEAQASPDTETTLPFEDPISRSDRLRRQWEAAVDEIREVEGFENFLRPMPFADLQKAAAQGPVILINIDRMRSDAIIVTSQHQPIVVPLPSATPERVEALVGLFQGVAKSLPKSNAYDSLRSLWEDFGEPIVSALEGIPDVPKGSRIWWCPTGAVTALPLHAAGNYYARGKRLPDLYVSSYTPTLSALSRARQVRLQRSGVPSILAIGQSRTPNLRPLPAVPEELARVKGRMPHMTAIEDEHGTCDAVLSTVRQHRWIHLACHGIVRPENPLQSHFALHNGPLSLFQLMQIRLPDAELAFLSCCHSASGNSNIPDEFLHLAAGMQFSGFKSVVATMWAMNDAVGPTLADEFYRVLLGRKGKGDYRNSAKALSDALKILRREGIPLEVWINFVHWGA